MENKTNEDFINDKSKWDMNIKNDPPLYYFVNGKDINNVVNINGKAYVPWIDYYSSEGRADIINPKYLSKIYATPLPVDFIDKVVIVKNIMVNRIIRFFKG